MPYIQPKGNPQSPIWIILDKPFSSDIPSGICASGGMGFFLERIFKEAYINTGDLYVCTRRPDTDNPGSVSSVDNFISTYKPPILLFFGEAAQFFLPELRASAGGTYKGQLSKYAGSLLKIPAAGWEHWAMALPDPETLVADWSERNIVTYADLSKIQEEYQHWIKYRKVRPYLDRTLLAHEMTTEEIIYNLDALFPEKILSVDIETIYPRKNSEYYGEHPGVPITVGIASSPVYALSFNPFRSTAAESIQVWRKLDALLGRTCVKIIGQNFFNFDSYFFNMLGFTLIRGNFSDTLLRHHVLWPELPHSLQFLTRQYTRQPYYKDEGKTWSLKKLGDLRHYNCLDAAVTLEVWHEQEKEFAKRLHLR